MPHSLSLLPILLIYPWVSGLIVRFLCDSPTLFCSALFKSPICKEEEEGSAGADDDNGDVIVVVEGNAISLNDNCDPALFN